MKIKYGRQTDFDSLIVPKIDLFLFAGNHEKRIYTALKQFRRKTQIEKCLGFCYDKEFEIDSSLNVENIVLEDHTEIFKILDEILFKIEDDRLNIVVDYSCMTKSWYYSIILYFSNRNLEFTEVNIYFVYTPSVYSEPQLPKYNIDISPLPGKYVVPTDKPKALIVCLGYEQNKAEGIIDHLDPKISYLFYTDPAFDERFVSKLKVNNSHLLSEQSKNVICYPFDDLLDLERKLTAIYYKHKDYYNIIIAPLGPKPFTLVAMLMAAIYSDIDIWRVGSGSDINVYDREPFDDNRLIINKVVFEK